MPSLLRTLTVTGAAGMLAMAGIAPATAAPNPGTCQTENMTTGAKGDDVVQAVATATAGDTIQVKGTCTTDGAAGGIVIDKEITLHGSRPANGNVAQNGKTGPTIDAEGTSRVLYVTPDGDLTLAGHLTITGGNATTGDTTEQLSGGGIYNDGGSVTIADHTTIIGNTAPYFGGGIYNDGGTVTLTDRASITANTARIGSGGGIYNNAGTVSMRDQATIADNRVLDRGGGGIYNFWGVVTMADKAAITGNVALGGGGISNQGGTVTMTDKAAITLNTGYYIGGGISNQGGTVTMTDKAAITLNTANNYGGGIYNSGTLNGVVADGNVYENTAPEGKDIHSI